MTGNIDYFAPFLLYSIHKDNLSGCGERGKLWKGVREGYGIIQRSKILCRMEREK